MLGVFDNRCTRRSRISENWQTLSLSEQNLVDCSYRFGNKGCNGGLMTYAYNYIKQNHGIDTEASYPYAGRDEKCRFNRSNTSATDEGYYTIQHGDELKLKEAVALHGPISVAIDASNPSFQFYKNGIYYEEKCNSLALDHAVSLV